MSRVRLARVVRELPRRAHDLSRKAVHDSQKWRILEAITEVTAKMGYGDASVADVIAVAGVSRKTFYEHFSDKEDCFLTAYGVLSDRLVKVLVGVGAGHPDGAKRRRAQVTAFLKALSLEPAAARVFIVDVLGAGPRALRKRERVNASFAEAIVGGAIDDPVGRAAIVGGVNNVVSAALLEGRARELLGLASPLSEFVERALGRAR